MSASASPNLIARDGMRSVSKRRCSKLPTWPNRFPEGVLGCLRQHVPEGLLLRRRPNPWWRQPRNACNVPKYT